MSAQNIVKCVISSVLWDSSFLRGTTQCTPKTCPPVLSTGHAPKKSEVTVYVAYSALQTENVHPHGAQMPTLCNLDILKSTFLFRKVQGD